MISVARGGRLILGDGVFLNSGSGVHAEHSIEIGNRVRIADLACVYDTDYHQVVPGAEVRVEGVVIEDEVWIGRGAVVLPGVSVGRGSVIAAGAIVTEDVPEGCVVAGNPARPIRHFSVPPDFQRR
jgi:maltose O-acetyltransferase